MVLNGTIQKKTNTALSGTIQKNRILSGAITSGVGGVVPNLEHVQIDMLGPLKEEIWTRPSGWPDLDSLSLTMSGSDYIYMTYDASQSNAAIVWHIETTNDSAATVDIGHITNGSFIVDETTSVTHNTDYIRSLSDLSGYIVVRITGSIKKCYAKSVTNNGFTQHFRQQPLLERIAYVPNLTDFANNNTNAYAWGMWSLQREKVGNGTGEALTSTKYMYYECTALKSLDVSGLHTPNVTTMEFMFNGCFCIQPNLDLRHFSVGNVTSFSCTFQDCRSLDTIDIRGWDTSKVTTMYRMFYNCRGLKEIKGLESIDTGLVTSMEAMFYWCVGLKEIHVENFDMSNCEWLYQMFYSCVSVEVLDLNSWNVSKLKSFGSTFSYCYSLKEIKNTQWSASCTVTRIDNMCSYCHSLRSIDLSHFNVTSACTNMGSAFRDCFSLKSLSIPTTWDLSGIASTNGAAAGIFWNCYSLESLTGIANWNLSNCTTAMDHVFSNCQSLKTLDVSGWSVGKATSFANMFDGCKSLTELDLSDWSVSKSTSFNNMFNTCYSLTSIGDISDWNTESCTNFAYMFNDCNSLMGSDFPDISDWDMSNATTTANMFSGCYSVKEITLRNLTLTNCTTIANMFRYCYNLRKIDLSGWSIPKVTKTAPSSFLGDCWNLQDVTIFAIPLNHSYGNCRSLTHASLLNILNSLPSVTETKTLNLTASNLNRLTSAEKAIATNKGWTLAN